MKELKTSQKVEIIIAAVLTVALLVAVPVYAWFAEMGKMETMAKVKAPTNLDIRAGHYHPIINFELSNVNIEEMRENNTPEYRVFSVSAGDYKINYNLQLAHTTNIPFKYSIYKATEVDSASANTVAYKPLYKDPGDDSTDGITYYYQIGDQIGLTLLNGDDAQKSYFGRTLAKGNDDFYNQTYSTGDDPEIYAVPLYWQSGKITPSNKEQGDSHDYYVLKIEWDEEQAETNFSKWNKAENNKETDIIYISASRSTN